MLNDPAAQARQLFQDLSDQSLCDLAGDNVFARGKTYAASGAVQDLEDLPPTLEHLMGARATVHGTALYSTEVGWLPDKKLNAHCECLHAQDGFFCKHQVALALVWRARLGGTSVTPDPDAAKKVQAAAKRAQTKANNIETLRLFVFAQKAENLAALLWRMADWDKDLMAQLKAWHAQCLAQTKLSSGDTQAAHEAVRELLQNPKGYLEPRDCGPYLRKAEQMFPIIDSVFKQSPAQARALCEDALKRLYKVGETADDSWGGEFSDLIPRATDWLKRCLQADPPPASWLKNWLALVNKDPWGLVPAYEVVAAAGPAVQKAYSAQVAKDWHEWYAAHPKPLGSWDRDRNQRRKAYLDDLKRLGDEVTVLEVMRNTAQTEGEWADLVQWCEEHQRWREAFDFAQKAFKLHHKDWRIEAAMLRAYERDGYDEEALAMWRQRLRLNPNCKNYIGVCQAAVRAGQTQAAIRDELMAWAKSQETRSERVGHGPQSGVRTVTDVSVRLLWLLEAEGDTLSALRLALTPQVHCQPHLLKQLALTLPATHASESVALLLRVLHANMALAKSPYREELTLVKTIVQRLDAQERQACISELRTQYKIKPNFIKGLPTP